jgi:hypothetical protein
MANIPTIPGTQMVQDQPIGVKMDPTAGLQLNAQIAQTVGTAATVIGQYEEKKQKATEFDIANKTYLGFTALRQQFDKEIDTTPHEQLVPKWEQMSNDWKAQQLDQYGGKLSPEARQEMSANWDKAIIGVRGDAQTIAERKYHAEVIGGVDAVYDKAAQSLDPAILAAAKLQGQKAVELGILTKGQIEDKDNKLDIRAEEEQIETARTGSIQDKLETIQKLKDKNQFTKIPALRRPAFINQLNGAIASQQTQNGEVYTDIVASGDPSSWPTKEQLHEDVLSKRISADRERAILGTIYAKTKAITAEEMRIKREQNSNAVAVVNNLISNHDWNNDPTPDATYQTISDASANLEERLRSPILKEAAIKRDQAKNKLKMGESKEDSPVEKEIMRKGEMDFKAGLFVAPIKDAKAWTNLLPSWLQPTIARLQPEYDTTWEKRHTTPEIETAYTRYAVWQDAMRKHIKEQKARSAKTGEPLSLSELNAYGYTLKQGDLEQAVSDQVF